MRTNSLFKVMSKHVISIYVWIIYSDVYFFDTFRGGLAGLVPIIALLELQDMN